MSRPLIVVQFSDPHIGADWGGADPSARLRAAVDQVAALDLRPDGGDRLRRPLRERVPAEEYAFVADRSTGSMRPSTSCPATTTCASRCARPSASTAASPIPSSTPWMSASCGCCSATRSSPAQEGGAYDAERLAWLEAELTREPEAPTLIAMHHPPIRTGIPAFDEIGLPDADRRAFAELVAGHRRYGGSSPGTSTA